MKCKCLEQLHEEFWEEEGKKPILDKYVAEQGFRINFKTQKTFVRTYSTMEIRREGRKTKEKMKIWHNFCPFCGEKEEPDCEEG